MKFRGDVIIFHFDLRDVEHKLSDGLFHQVHVRIPRDCTYSKAEEHAVLKGIAMQVLDPELPFMSFTNGRIMTERIIEFMEHMRAGGSKDDPSLFSEAPDFVEHEVKFDEEDEETDPQL